MVAPFSSPGLRASGITFKQCIHLTQFLFSTVSSSLSSSESELVGQRVITLSITYLRPFFATNSLTLSWSTFMSSFQVPIIEKSALSIELTQSFGHPETLNLNL